MKMKLPSNQRGFALVEIIIAIGVLAVVSMFILQMFVRSANLANKAHDKDMACFEAQGVVEQLKATLEPVSQKSGQVYALTRVADDVWERYYDSSWAATAQKPDKGFVLRVEIKNAPRPGTEQTALAWKSIAVSVTKSDPYLMEEKPTQELISLEAYVYYPGKEAVA